METFRRIFGFTLLTIFISYFIYKLNNNLSNLEDGSLITALIVIIVAMILLGLHKIITK